MAHDEGEDAQMGDRVRFVEAKPISRHKRWRFVQVLSRAELPDVAPESIDLELLGEVKREEVIEPVAAPASGGASEAAEPAAGAEVEAMSSPAVDAVVTDEIKIEETVQAEKETETPAGPEPASDEGAAMAEAFVVEAPTSDEEARAFEQTVEDEREPDVVDEAEAAEVETAPKDEPPASAEREIAEEPA